MIDVIIGLFFSLFMVILLPEFEGIGRYVSTAIVFFIASVTALLLIKTAWTRLEVKVFRIKHTRLLVRFIDRLRFSYTLDNLIEAVQEVLEYDADCSVLYVNSENNYVIYNSSTEIAMNPATLTKLNHRFSSSWPEGWFLMDEDLGLTTDFFKGRGFFLVCGNLRFYVFCRYMLVFEEEIFKHLLDEFNAFLKRSKTINDLTAISELSKEWSMLAETQVSFLPAKMPELKGLEAAAYFRPLVNVSGDFYDIIPLNEDQTFFLLGDVSGKGLASALVMGVVMNTVKITGNKNDLPGVIRNVHSAIKAMHLQDKYCVMFIGIIDTKKQTIRYVNASMADPLIVSRKLSGEYEINPLESTCSLVGIIDLDDIEERVVPLHPGDLLLMASDGVSEAKNLQGDELGDTDLYMQTVKNSAHKSAAHFVNDISDLVLSYCGATDGTGKLRDDVTMLVAKMEEAV